MHRAHAPRGCALHDCGQVAWVTGWGTHCWVARYTSGTTGLPKGCMHPHATIFKVWSAKVEALMFRYPAVQEARAISTRDSYRGESVKAVVVLRQPHRGQVDENDIVAWCRDDMAVYKAPWVVQWVDSLLESGSGKVM